ncbi:hypothetical protein LXL04_034660 [Taraxacum kok-saghyz]
MIWSCGARPQMYRTIFLSTGVTIPGHNTASSVNQYSPKIMAFSSSHDMEFAAVMPIVWMCPCHQDSAVFAKVQAAYFIWSPVRGFVPALETIVVTPPDQTAETSEGGDFIWISQHIHKITKAIWTIHFIYLKSTVYIKPRSLGFIASSLGFITALGFTSALGFTAIPPTPAHLLKRSSRVLSQSHTSSRVLSDSDGTIPPSSRGYLHREVFVWISYMASIDSRSIESEDEDGGNVRHFDLLQEKKWITKQVAKITQLIVRQN